MRTVTPEVWHLTPRHKRGKRPKGVVPAFVGNKNRPINSAKNLQRALTAERKDEIEKQKLAATL